MLNNTTNFDVTWTSIGVTVVRITSYNVCYTKLLRLDTNENERLKIIDEELNQFPYVNGKLFAESIRKTAFNAQMREQILVCSYNFG